MISIQITEHGIQMSGHAQCKESDGIDRACAAVSALTCNLINSLMELTGDRIRADTESGMAIVEWEKLSDKGKLLVDSWFVDDAPFLASHSSPIVPVTKPISTLAYLFQIFWKFVYKINLVIRSKYIYYFHDSSLKMGAKIPPVITIGDYYSSSNFIPLLHSSSSSSAILFLGIPSGKAIHVGNSLSSSIKCLHTIHFGNLILSPPRFYVFVYKFFCFIRNLFAVPISHKGFRQR